MVSWVFDRDAGHSDWITRRTTEPWMPAKQAWPPKDRMNNDHQPNLTVVLWVGHEARCIE